MTDPPESWNRLFGLSYSELKPGTRASITPEELPSWLIDACSEPVLSPRTNLRIYDAHVLKCKVPVHWFSEQNHQPVARGDTTKVLFRIAEYCTEGDVLHLLGPNSPLTISPIRRCFFNPHHTEAQQLEIYRKETALRIISMVSNYHNALDGLGVTGHDGERNRPIPHFRTWQKNEAMSHQPHLYDHGKPVQNAVLPLPTQLVDPGTTEGLSTVVNRMQSVGGWDNVPSEGPASESSVDDPMLALADEAIASQIRAEKKRQIEKIYEGLSQPEDAPAAKKSLQLALSIVCTSTGSS